MGEATTSSPGGHAEAVVRAERALRDGRAELAESRERAGRDDGDPGRPGPAGPGPSDLRAAALALRRQLGLAPVGVPPAPLRGAPSGPTEDEHFGDTGVLYRA